MTDHKPLISLITVDYNGLELTCALLESLKRNVPDGIEIIVVDNGSENDDAAEIRKRYPYVHAIRSTRNLGFAGGNNLGAKAASGEYLFFINNDTEILDGNIGALLEAFDRNPEAGVVCPKIRFWDGERRIQFAGYTPMKGIAMKNDLIGFNRIDDGSFDTPAESPFAHGAAMMVSRMAFEDVGPMPECYFLYFEELDWSLMFTRKGWKILYEPAFTVYHKESATTGRESPLRSYYMQRNRQLFARRNYSGAMQLMVILYARYLSGGKRILKALKDGRPDLAKAVLKGNRDFLKLKKDNRENN